MFADGEGGKPLECVGIFLQREHFMIDSIIVSHIIPNKINNFRQIF